MRNDEGLGVREADRDEQLSEPHATAAKRSAREREWLEREVEWAATLSDAERVHIMRDLWRTAEAIRRGKTEENQRAEQVRRLLDEPGRERYRALIERLAGTG